MFIIRRVEGKSMWPRYRQGTVVIARRNFSNVKVGDVVIVRHARQELMKRISKMENNELFVLGDNPPASTDSRHFGWLPMDAIIGVVMGARAND